MFINWTYYSNYLGKLFLFLVLNKLNTYYDTNDKGKIVFKIYVIFIDDYDLFSALKYKMSSPLKIKLKKISNQIL